MASGRLVQALFEGAIDIVGDIHGEIGALRQLLQRLGYDEGGRHPKGRRLVFVGDLGDRGPNSPAVVECVRSFVTQGLAQCLLGNHELNLLRNESKPGNRWFIDPSHAEQRPGGEFAQCRVAPKALKPAWLAFFGSLPLALERKDLRVVHAAWISGDIEVLRQAGGSTLEAYRAFELRTQQQLEIEGLIEAASLEQHTWGEYLENRNVPVPLLPALGKIDERYQMGNPVRVLTSGVERLAEEPFWSGGKWRMCQRVRWWEQYMDPVPVVVGHYWRQFRPAAAAEHLSTKPQMFPGAAPTDWVGARQNVFCVDFSVGARYQERKAGAVQFDTHLAAMRWPEQELWLETGRVD